MTGYDFPTKPPAKANKKQMLLEGHFAWAAAVNHDRKYPIPVCIDTVLSIVNSRGY